jgi:hypothetical protein
MLSPSSAAGLSDVLLYLWEDLTAHVRLRTAPRLGSGTTVRLDKGPLHRLFPSAASLPGAMHVNSTTATLSPQQSSIKPLQPQSRRRQHAVYDVLGSLRTATTAMPAFAAALRHVREQVHTYAHDTLPQASSVQTAASTTPFRRPGWQQSSQSVI